MSEPVAYVSTWRIKDGKFEDYRRFYAELVKIVDENEPRLTAFLTFANDDLTEITNVHVFPDRGTLDRHMDVLGEKMRLLPGGVTAVMRYLEPVRVEVFGTRGGKAARCRAQVLAAAQVLLAVDRTQRGEFSIA